ncbi:adhesion G-protein coupled receptor G2-like [Oscarella lobularis]|uniref:adhesion G-protein coupled receptor G2-like n=1 Tax=Oscarella lobularis TaxID=121494 RepID=UPI0033138A80
MERRIAASLFLTLSIALLATSLVSTSPCDSNEDRDGVLFESTSNATLELSSTTKLSFRFSSTSESGTLVRAQTTTTQRFLFRVSIRDARFLAIIFGADDAEPEALLNYTSIATTWNRIEIEFSASEFVVALDSQRSVARDYGAPWPNGEPISFDFGVDGFVGCLSRLVDFAGGDADERHAIALYDFNGTANLSPCCPPPTFSALLTDDPTSTALLTESLLHPTPIVRSTELRSTPTMSTPLPFTRPAPMSTIVVRNFRALSSSFSPSTIFFETPSPTPTFTPSRTSLSPAHEIRLLMKAGVGKENVTNVAKNLSRLTSDTSKSAGSSEIVSAVVDLMETIVGLEINETARYVMETASHLMDFDEEKLTKSQEANNTSVRLLNLIDDVAQNVSLNLTSSTFSWAFSNLKLLVVGVDPKTIPASPENQTRGFLFDSLSDRTQLELSGEALEKPLQHGVFHRWWFVSYSTSKLFQSGEVNGTEVIAASVSTGAVRNLSDHIELVFNTRFFGEVVRSLSCVFWKFNSSSQMGGSWSSEGCKVQKQYESNGTVICQCDHLTHFTVIPGEAISQPAAFTKKKLAVYVGCAIAAVFLSISLFIFICFKRIRSKRAVAHANLCLCLLACNVLFAISINGSSSQAVCRGIAISFHLFVVLAFLWLVGEAVELCHAAVGRMGTCFDVHRLKLVLPLLWGIAIIYVGLWSYFVYDSYGCNAGFCFLSVDYAWIVIGPTAGLSLVAFFIWLIAACACCRTREESHMRPQLMLKKTGLLLILATQTLAWISALLWIYWESHLDYLIYLFIANTAIEGVLVFAFLCVLDNAVKDKFSLMCGCAAEKDLSSSSQNSNVLVNRGAPEVYSLNVIPRIQTQDDDSAAAPDDETSGIGDLATSLSPSEMGSSIGNGMTRWSSLLSANFQAASTPKRNPLSTNRQVSFTGSTILDEVLSNEQATGGNSDVVFIQAMSIAELREMEMAGVRTDTGSEDQLEMESRI